MVCPVDAIGNLIASHVPEIDAETCLGCGLCVARCPVGAISIEAEGFAVVHVPERPRYAEVTISAGEFVAARSKLAVLLDRETAPFHDANLVARQLERFEAGLISGIGERALPLFARNVFLTLGYSARLKNTGDNNAFAELTVGAGDSLLLLEIETAGTEIDAFRRVISGAAVATNRYGVTLDRIIPGVVVARLPNTRVDYYEAIKNAAARIDISVRTIPLSALLLGVRSGGDELLDFVAGDAVVDSDNLSLEATVARVWGATPRAGLSPSK